MMIGVVALLVSGPTDARAQLWGRVCGGSWIGGGSTPIGDIARGRGVEAAGVGQYNLDTAIANRINVESSILLNEYIYSSIQEGNREKAEHKMAELRRKIEHYNKILDRIKNDPDLRDRDSGDALNVLRDELLRISPSSLRLALVVLPGETIRQIPFQYAQKGVTFSMDRLMAGTTVRELLEFMNRHKLRFSAARTPAECDLYRHLFASLIQQRVLLEASPNPAAPPRS
jgi:hypothetical protein